MKFTPRMDGSDRATVRIAFHVQMDDLVTAAMLVLDGTADDVSSLTKGGIEDRLRSDLWSDGDNFCDFGMERIIDHRVRAARDEVTARVAALYGLSVRTM